MKLSNLKKTGKNIQYFGRTNLKLFLIIIFYASLEYACFAQDNKETIQKKIKFDALLVGRYTASFQNDVDFEGKHSTGSEDNITTNSFSMTYARIKSSYTINKKFKAVINANLADFKTNPQTKVLESAYLTYHQSPYLDIRAGQFRPYFGLEDRFSFELEKFWRWSDQYSGFGKSGWMSFQIGAALSGSLKEKNIPLNYFFTVYNGNGKNQVQDDDDSKNYTVRLEYSILPQIRMGASYGLSNFKSEEGKAFGFDLLAEYKLRNYALSMITEYKKGSNLYEFKKQLKENLQHSLDDMEGFFVQPIIRRNVNSKLAQALEFAFRYEYFKNLSTIDNYKQSYTPMLSFVFAGDYNVKLSLAFEMNRFKRQIANSTTHDSDRGIIQFQLFF